MKFQVLSSGKNKKNISKCRLLKLLPGMLIVTIFREHTKCTTIYGKTLLGRIKRKNAYEHAQNAQVSDHPAHALSIIRVFALHLYTL